ncbi:hypothetical protein KK137_00255 [Croceibacterium sp. LX-88]|uniref:Uncharacterized protein n=1 Tax=Croceibacterium selenioxidans TaxID=2838833 RepID=A0ABS5W0J2_9SPHN|nr:hypothetical protein [Croceibacterium selenioxidans]MBT2132750.1 hypothetical protein [Croceibacterium selenioxidans]
MKSANRRDVLTIASLAAVGIVVGALTAPLFAPVPKTPAYEPTLHSGRARVPAETQSWAEPDLQGTTVEYSGTYGPSDAYDGAIWQYPAPVYEPWEPVSTLPQEDMDVAEPKSAREIAHEAEEAVKDAAAAAARQSETVRKSSLPEGLY